MTETASRTGPPRLPLIVVADRQAPMRRALRRLLGETRFAWREVQRPEELRRDEGAEPPALYIIEDRLLASSTDDSLAGLGAPDRLTPIILVSTCTTPLPAQPSAALRRVVIVDRLELCARLPGLAEVLLAGR